MSEKKRQRILCPSQIFEETQHSPLEYSIKVKDIFNGNQSVGFLKNKQVITCHNCHLEFKKRRKFLIHLFKPLHLPKIICLCQKAFTYTTFGEHWRDAEDCKNLYVQQLTLVNSNILTETVSSSSINDPFNNDASDLDTVSTNISVEIVDNLHSFNINEIIEELESHHNEIYENSQVSTIIPSTADQIDETIEDALVPTQEAPLTVWSIFELETDELVPFSLPDEAVGRAVKNNFPDSIYTRKYLTNNEERLFALYEEFCGNNKDVKNPYTDSKLSNIPVNDVSVETMKRKWSQMARILGFDLNLSVRDVLWEIIRPKNIKLFINIAQQNKMSKKSMAHIAEYCYRMAWMMNSKKFLSVIQMDHLPETQMLSFYATLGLWYCKSIPWMISDAKRSTLQHRDLDSLKAQGKWEETETMIKVLDRLTTDINESSTLNHIRNAAIYAFIVTTCPPRAQNLRLLLIPSGELKTHIQIRDLVKIYNSEIPVKIKQAQCISGVMYEDKSPDGRYNIVWTEFKTVKAFGIQTRTISHPVAIKFFDLWLSKRDKGNNVLWQNASGKPMYKVGECFQAICRLYLNKNISISDYRIISTTKIKECGSNKEFQEFAHLCLHSESISNIHCLGGFWVKGGRKKTAKS